MYKLIFKGKDYSLIDCNEPNVEIYDDQGSPLDRRDFPLHDKFIDILITFLDSFDEKDLERVLQKTENEGPEDEETEKKRLYTKSSNALRYGGLIGFLRKKDFTYNFAETESKTTTYHLDITLRCTSRFDDEKGYFLCSLLLHNNLSFVDSLIPTDDQDDIFEYLLLLRFVSLLKEASLRGYYRKYVTFQNNDDRLKGAIDFARHIKLNCGYDNGKIAYSYRENTVKNPLNMLILAAYHKLKNKFPALMECIFTRDDEDIVNTLKSELGYYDCSTLDLIKLNSKPIYHPYYFEYESLRQICLKILRDVGINLFASEETDDVNGYLVYVPNLWENFLKDHFEQFDDFHVEPQYSTDAVRSENQKNAALNIRPDFVFKDQNNSLRMMLDAKFIPKWQNATEKDNFSSVSGDFNKCVRDMTCLEIHKTGVVFPCEKDGLFKSYTINKTDKFYAMGIPIPATTKHNSFDQWNAEFENGIKQQIEKKLLPIYNEG